jgi:hypothetical protein
MLCKGNMNFGEGVRKVAGGIDTSRNFCDAKTAGLLGGFD